MPPIHPALDSYFGVPGYAVAWLISLSGVSLFAYLVYKRFTLIRLGQADPRFSPLAQRLSGLLSFGILQKRQPRYPAAGVVHIVIFWGFVVLGLRSIDLLTQGLNLPLLGSFMDGRAGVFYSRLKDLFELAVLAACLTAVLRRALFRPSRYEGSHRAEAYLVLALISALMVTDVLYEGSGLLLSNAGQKGLPAAGLAALLLPASAPAGLKAAHYASYWLHLLIFFAFLNLLPLSKHFHIITALPNVFFRKARKGSLKPARWGVEAIEDLESMGVGKLEDFTWKHGGGHACGTPRPCPCRGRDRHRTGRRGRSLSRCFTRRTRWQKRSLTP